VSLVEYMLISRASAEGGGRGRESFACNVQLELTRLFSKQTSKAVSARLVNAMRVSPVMSLGRP
jgi:hypothetical protein